MKHLYDVGFYQIRNAMKDFPAAGAPSLRAAHDALREKLLPQIYAFGFLNPDVVYFLHSLSSTTARKETDEPT